MEFEKGKYYEAKYIFLTDDISIPFHYFYKILHFEESTKDEHCMLDIYLIHDVNNTAHKKAGIRLLMVNKYTLNTFNDIHEVSARIKEIEAEKEKENWPVKVGQIWECKLDKDTVICKIDEIQSNNENDCVCTATIIGCDTPYGKKGESKIIWHIYPTRNTYTLLTQAQYDQRIKEMEQPRSPNEKEVLQEELRLMTEDRDWWEEVAQQRLEKATEIKSKLSKEVLHQAKLHKECADNRERLKEEIKVLRYKNAETDNPIRLSKEESIITEEVSVTPRITEKDMEESEINRLRGIIKKWRDYEVAQGLIIQELKSVVLHIQSQIEQYIEVSDAKYLRLAKVHNKLKAKHKKLKKAYAKELKNNEGFGF